jgi:septum site-determining protein MinD
MSQQHKVISVLSGKGGVGKTTISAGLGCIYATLGLKTLIIDLDMGLRNLDLQFQLQGDIVFDLSHVLDGYVPLSEAIIQVPDYPNLSILASSLQKNFETIDLQNIQTMIHQAKELFDIIILDAPAGTDSKLLNLIHYSDLALLISSPYLSSLRSIDKILGQLHKKLKTYWMINRMPHHGEEIKSYIHDIDFPLSGCIPEIPSLLEAQYHNTSLNQHTGKLLLKSLYPVALTMIGQSAPTPVSPLTPPPKQIANKHWLNRISSFVQW